MPSRKVNKRPLRKSPIGDLRERIELFAKNIQAPVFNSASHTQEFTLIAEVWAKIVTRSPGEDTFTDVNVQPQNRVAQATHIFTIRYRSDISAETVVLYEGNYYEILNIDDTETRNEYWVIHAKLLGDSSLKANQ
jgi:SPP1 family predicted phage head-tail adaptor